MNYQLMEGDCLDVMAGMEAESISSIVTDPPYGLSFMGRDWDHGVPGVAFWEQALRVAKPGAFLLAFGGSRTFHRLTCAIEDAGWEIRDCIMWVYGSGFPHGTNISKAIDAKLGAERDNLGTHRPENRKVYGKNAGALRCSICGNSRNGTSCNCPLTAPATDAARAFDGYFSNLKPAFEPIIIAMKPVEKTFAENALKWGVSGLNIDGCRVPTEGRDKEKHLAEWDRIQSAKQGGNSMNAGLKAIDLNGYAKEGRFPANLIHDGSEEVNAVFDKAGVRKTGAGGHTKTTRPGWGMSGDRLTVGYDDSGSAARYFMCCPPDAARFFYCAKSSSSEKSAGVDDGNTHCTVKPLELCRYLVKLVSPPANGIILDPFMGSGSTGVAALLEGVDFIGIEQEAEYMEIARQRLEHYEDERSVEPIKLSGKAGDFDNLPMFAEVG